SVCSELPAVQREPRKTRNIRKWLSLVGLRWERERPLEVGAGSRVYVSDHVEVVMVDVNYFYRIFVAERMRYRPTDASIVAEVNRALVVSVVQLRRAN